MSRLPFSNRFTLRQQSRLLTTGERAIAHSVFGDSLALNNIRLKTAWWVLRHYAVSPNGNIYFHPEDWVTDFSQQSIAQQSWLVHELTHVWQLQQSVVVLRRAVLDRRYRYQLVTDKPFLAYGVEQQAQMVQDFFVQRARGQDCSALAACIPFAHAQADIAG